MEGGTNTSLGIMVGIIIFSIFLVIVSGDAGLVTGIGEQIYCITDFVRNGPGGCGGEEPIEIVEDNRWPSGEEWSKMPGYARNTIQKEFLKYLEEEIPGFDEKVDLPYRMNNNIYTPPATFVYGHFDDDGNLLKTYVLGDTVGYYEGDPGISILLSDPRLLPEGLTVDKVQDFGTYESIRTTNKLGNKVAYRVYK